MKHLKGAWLAYWIIFLVFEIMVMSYVAVFDRYHQMSLFNGWHSFTFDYLFRGFSFAGELLIPILVLIFFIYKKRAWIKPFLISYALSTVVVQGLKHFVFSSALRPLAYFKSLDASWYMVPGVEIHELNSFPSGHTAAGWFCFLWIALIINKSWAGVLMALFACGVGISRVYLFQHFPIDVAAGAFIGITCSSIIYYVYHEDITA